MMDASGGIDKQRHRIYCLLTPCASGGLPLGMIITDKEKESVLFDALQCLKSILKEKAFFGQKMPRVFITDNDLKEINALKKAFPNSVKLLCQFHMLKSVWYWLCNTKHNIGQNHRQEIYFLFKKVMYSKSEDDAFQNYINLKESAKNKSYANLVIHIENLWSSKKSWVTYCRNNLPIRGNDTTNYVEVLFRILKNCIFDRIMAFNLTQLVDLILTRYEMYLKQRLVDFCNGSYHNSLLKKMMPTICEKHKYFIELNHSLHVFNVKNELGETNTVDLCKGFCTCTFGITGKLCKHASAVILFIDKDISFLYNICNEQTKKSLFFVAEGKIPPSNWFASLQQTSESSVESLSCSKTKSPDYNVLKSDNCRLSEETISNNQNDDNLDLLINNNSSLTQEENEQLKNLFNRITNGLEENPNVFVPAVRKMLKNERKFAYTETGLLSSLHTFGRYNGQPSAQQIAAKKSLRKSHKFFIGVQPTALGRRKMCLSGRKKISAGRPTGRITRPHQLHEHDYTTFGNLPARKRKAPHDIESCVFDNKSLGSTKHKKD